MSLWLAVLFPPILLWVTSNAIKTEPGFPTDCGIPLVQRIFNDDAWTEKVQATPNSWTWHVGLWAERMGVYPFCGGTLISDSIVVTAAHCIEPLVRCAQLPPYGKPFNMRGTSGDRLRVLVGAHDFKKIYARKQLRQVACAIIHPEYNTSETPTATDVALIKLRTAIPKVPKICFPDKNVKAARGSMCFYAGWGGLYRTKSATKKSYPKKLREAQVELTSDEACLEAFDDYSWYSRACIKSDGRSPCDGDSGGGLFCPSPDNNRFYWYGMVLSSSEDCKSTVAIVSRVSAIHQWIVQAAHSLGL